MAGSIKGIIVEIGGDTSGLQKALRKVNSETSSLSKELKGINRLLKLDPKNTELLNQKQTVLKESIEATKNKIKELKNVYNESVKAEANGAKISEENWRALRKEIEKNEIELRRLQVQASNFTKIGNFFTKVGSNIENFGSNIIGVNEKLSNLNSKISTFGSTLTTKVTLPVTALGASTVTTAISFLKLKENTKIAFQVLLGSAEKAQKMLDDLYTFAKTTPFSYDTYLTAGKNLTAMGVAAENVIPYLEKMTNAAIATGAGQEGINTLTEAIGRMSSKGKIQLEELNRIIELGVPAVKILGNAYGKTEEKIYDMMSVGELLAKDALPKLLEGMNNGTNGVNGMTAAYGGLASEMKGTLSGALDSLHSKFRNMSLQIWDAENAYPELTNVIKDFTNSLDVVPKIFKSVSIVATPALKSLSSKLKKLNDYLSKADPKQLEKVGKAILGLAAAGPALSLTSKLLNVVTKLGTGLGTLVKGTGTAVKGIGTFSKAIAVAINHTTSTDEKVNKLAGTLTKLTSPFGIATLAIAAVTAEIAIMDKKLGENLRNTKEYTQTIKDNINSRKELANSQIEQMNGNISEINYIRNLNQELKNIVDENGKVKDGYQERVNFILNELNNALGTEYTLNGNIIDAYQTMQKEIDNLINKKRAQIVIETQEEQYREAIQNKTKDYQELISTQDKLAEAQKRRNDAENEFLNAQKYGGNAISTMKYKKAIDEVNELTDTYNKQKEVVEKNNSAINKYEKNVELMAKGTKESYDQIYQSINEVQTAVTATEQTEMAKRIESLQYNLEESRRMYNLEAEYNKNAKDNIYATNVEESEKNLQLAIDELTKATSTVGEMSPDVIQAWKNLATNSREEYKTALSKMPQDMQDRINNITGVVNADTSVSSATNGLGLAAVENFNKEKEAEEAGKNLIKGVNSGINNQTEQAKAKNSASIFSSAILGIFHKVWDEHSPSHASEKSAVNLIKGIPIGIKKAAPQAYKEVEKTSSNILSAFNSNLNFNSLQNIPKLQSSISQTISTQLQPKILQPNIVINTQHLDNNEMNRIIDTVNRRFGMQI